MRICVAENVGVRLGQATVLDDVSIGISAGERTRSENHPHGDPNSCPMHSPGFNMVVCVSFRGVSHREPSKRDRTRRGSHTRS